MSNVRDRIKAAEALTGQSHNDGGSESRRRGHKLSLKTDEHIKEEFLRRGDGGWHKKVDIGQQENFKVPPAMSPIIKLITETPVVTSSKGVPGRLRKEIPGAFEPVPGESSAKSGAKQDREWSRVEEMEAAQQAEMDLHTVDGEWDRVAQLEAEQQAAMDAEAAMRSTAESSSKPRREKPDKPARGKLDKSSQNKSSDSPATRNIPVGRFDDLIGKTDVKDTKNKSPGSKSRPSVRARHVHISDDDDDDDMKPAATFPAKDDLSSREQVLFDPVEYAEKKQARRERRAARQQDRAERLVVDEQPRERSRAKSPSIRLFRVNYDDDDDDDNDNGGKALRKSHRLRSRSTHDYVPESYQSPPTSARRSTNSLWPSFSDSQRRSMSDVFESSGRRRHSHTRTHSDDLSTADSTRSTVSIKKLEFAEYMAGRKLDHMPLSPPKLPSRPMGFVRSLSHTGEYSEGYTREKKLLRRPSRDEVIEDFDHDWDRRVDHSSRRRVSHKKDEPWQVKILQEIAKH
ncbi:hypothetical protein LTR05_004161 [Lithohypha guttulata]|uniref:Uncharacterized protein n=1 Tax=Lithohypha guttulata TaxID=1690604 RepID=A0AAN7T1D1_9EURO|nr:hypothetical protein LTR05_004161 [Lithohypha guttulata]